MNKNIITEQITQVGRDIEHHSFAIIDNEVDEIKYPQDEWQVVRRIIHASADFEFNGLTKFHKDALKAGVSAILSGAKIIADVEMIVVGLSKVRLQHFRINVCQYINDEDVINLAHRENTTRAVQAMRKAYRLDEINNNIIAIGNAPTALIELVRLIKEENVKPALIVGMPVGFVSAQESKELLMSINQIPWITIQGRKGGSTLVVATIHALLAISESIAESSPK